MGEVSPCNCTPLGTGGQRGAWWQPGPAQPTRLLCLPCCIPPPNLTRPGGQHPLWMFSGVRYDATAPAATVFDSDRVALFTPPSLMRFDARPSPPHPCSSPCACCRRVQLVTPCSPHPGALLSTAAGAQRGPLIHPSQAAAAAVRAPLMGVPLCRASGLPPACASPCWLCQPLFCLPQPPSPFVVCWPPLGVLGGGRVAGQAHCRTACRACCRFGPRGEGGGRRLGPVAPCVCAACRAAL